MTLSAALILSAGLLFIAPARSAHAVSQAEPADIALTLGPGQSATVATTVATPAVAPSPDIVFLADTTGSMDPVVANVRNNIDRLMDDILAAQPTARFAIAGYKDQVDGNKVFTLYTPITPDRDLVRAGAGDVSRDVIGGGAPWTDFINAHYRIATDAIGFRPVGTRIIAWYGDAASRDPSLGHTLADTNAALQALGARVVAVPIVGTAPSQQEPTTARQPERRPRPGLGGDGRCRLRPGRCGCREAARCVPAC